MLFEVDGGWGGLVIWSVRFSSFYFYSYFLLVILYSLFVRCGWFGLCEFVMWEMADLRTRFYDATWDFEEVEEKWKERIVEDGGLVSRLSIPL